MKTLQLYRIRAVTPTLALMLLAGCGGSDASVSGSLTLDGQPLASTDAMRVTIMFYPESGIGAPAAARADENGEYELSTGGQSGLSPGEYVVAVSANEVAPPANSPTAQKPRAISPPQYANPKLSGLRASVEPGSNTFDFDLKSQPTG